MRQLRIYLFSPVRLLPEIVSICA